jgi:hypothetical protein
MFEGSRGGGIVVFALNLVDSQRRDCQVNRLITPTFIEASNTDSQSCVLSKSWGESTFLPMDLGPQLLNSYYASSSCLKTLRNTVSKIQGPSFIKIRCLGAVNEEATTPMKCPGSSTSRRTNSKSTQSLTQVSHCPLTAEDA